MTKKFALQKNYKSKLKYYPRILFLEIQNSLYYHLNLKFKNFLKTVDINLPNPINKSLLRQKKFRLLRFKYNLLHNIVFPPAILLFIAEDFDLKSEHIPFFFLVLPHFSPKKPSQEVYRRFKRITIV